MVAGMVEGYMTAAYEGTYDWDNLGNDLAYIDTLVANQNMNCGQDGIWGLKLYLYKMDCMELLLNQAKDMEVAEFY